MPGDGKSSFAGVSWAQRRRSDLARSRSADVASISDRILTTVMFTDIVGSTERAAALGDARWREPHSGRGHKGGRTGKAHGGLGTWLTRVGGLG